jgi:hypothetical protein
MIHQFIYAVPRPGWPAERFQNYSLQEHSIRYATKNPQIRQYLVGPPANAAKLEGEPISVANESHFDALRTANAGNRVQAVRAEALNVSAGDVRFQIKCDWP